MLNDPLLTPARLLGRRSFLANLGRGTMAFAVIGVAGCSSGGADDTKGESDDASSPSTSDASGSITTESAENDDQLSSPDLLRWQQVTFSNVSAYLLIRGTEVAVVDTGFGSDPSTIEAGLGQLNASWSDVGHVILTHSHPDHIGGLATVLGNAPRAVAYAGVADLPAIDGLDGVDTDSIRGLNDGDEVFGLQIIGTPGHTPGHISVFDSETGLLVAGDAVNGNGNGGGLTGPNPQFTPDMDQANASVKLLAERDVETVLMGHGTPVPSGAGVLLTDLAAGL